MLCKFSVRKTCVFSHVCFGISENFPCRSSSGRYLLHFSKSYIYFPLTLRRILSKTDSNSTMKYYSTDSTIKNPWDQTIVAIWQRYPNPFSKHVLSEDALERRVDGPRLFTKRLLVKTNPLPKWGQRFVNLRQVAVLEESMVDRDQHLLVTYTRNIGYTHTMNVIEKCIYSPVDDPSKSSSKSTSIQREAWINSQVRGFASVLQRFGVERYKHNVQNANKGLAYVLARLFPTHSPVNIDTKSKLASVTDLVVHQIENATAKAAATNQSSL